MSVTFIKPNVSKLTGYGLRSSSNSPNLLPKKRNENFRRRVSFDTITSDIPISNAPPESNYSWYSSNNNSSTGLGLATSPPVNILNIANRSLSPPPYDASIDFGITGVYSNNDLIGGATDNGIISNTKISNHLISANLRDYMKDKDMSSFVVQSSHKDYKSSISSRTILFSLTSKDYSLSTLKWTIKNLLEDGDELVCLKSYHDIDDSTITNTKRSLYRKKAYEILDNILNFIDNFDLKINIIVELGIGKVKAMALKTLLLYQPSIVVCGTNEKSFSNLARVRYKKTVSSYLIARSPVPVIIVSPTRMTSINNEGEVSSGGCIRKNSTTITPSISPMNEFNSISSTTSPVSAVGSPTNTTTAFSFSQKRRRSSTSSDTQDGGESTWPGGCSGSLGYYSYINSCIKLTSKPGGGSGRVKMTIPKSTKDINTSITSAVNSPINSPINSSISNTSPTISTSVTTGIPTTTKPIAIPSTAPPTTSSITFVNTSPAKRPPFSEKQVNQLTRRRSADDNTSTVNPALRLSPSLSSDAATSSSGSNNSSNSNLPSTRNRRASSTTMNIARQTMKWTSKLSPSFLNPKTYRRNS